MLIYSRLSAWTIFFHSVSPSYRPLEHGNWLISKRGGPNTLVQVVLMKWSRSAYFDEWSFAIVQIAWPWCRKCNEPLWYRLINRWCLDGDNLYTVTHLEVMTWSCTCYLNWGHCWALLELGVSNFRRKNKLNVSEGNQIHFAGLTNHGK